MAADKDLGEDLVSHTLGADLDRLAASRLPGSFFLRKYSFTSEGEIRAWVHEAAKSARDLKSPKEAATKQATAKTPPSSIKRLSVEEKERLLEEWIQRLVKLAAKQGRLMTEQQLSDWNLGR